MSIRRRCQLLGTKQAKEHFFRFYVYRTESMPEAPEIIIFFFLHHLKILHPSVIYHRYTFFNEIKKLYRPKIVASGSQLLV